MIRRLEAILRIAIEIEEAFHFPVRVELVETFLQSFGRDQPMV
jgi:hypothetical protein